MSAPPGYTRPQKPPRHFCVILGPIAHLSIGPLAPQSFCGRDFAGHPVRYGYTAGEALKRCDCKACKRSVKP